MSSEMKDAGSEDVFVFPTSFAQQRLWIIDQLEPGRATYNIPFNVRLTGALNVRALEASIEYIVHRHEALRTVFEKIDGLPHQVVRHPATVALPVTDLTSLNADSQGTALGRLVTEEGNRPFDLSTGPLLRARLVKLGADEHLLLITAHHIVVDGWSIGVLQRELRAAYTAYAAGAEPDLPELPIQYADFAGWQRDRLEGQLLEEQLAYWVKELRHPLPVLQVPVDRPRGRGEAHPADRVMVEVPSDASDALAALARESETTAFVALLAAYHALLHRYSGDDDIIVGSPVAGRTRRETEELIGFFVNTLALRVDFSDGPSFRQLLHRVRTTVLGALEHQDVPFEKIVEVIQPERDRTRNPVFQTLFSLQDLGAAGGLTLPGLTVTKIAGARETAKFELQLILNTTPRGFRGMLEFDTELFDRETAEQFGRHFVALIRSAVTEPDRPIGELSMLSASERDTLLYRWNATDAPLPEDVLVHDLFAVQVARTPNAPAVTHDGQTIDYATLDARATALAHRLTRLSVGPDSRVAICVDRSIHMIVAVLGVLKAGGSYVPIDPAYPKARTQYMLENADVRAVLAVRATLDRLPLTDATTIVLDQADRPVHGIRTEPAARAAPDNLAYVLYTSGSTGMPKGVAMPHRPLVNLIKWQEQQSVAGPGTRTLQFASLSFDVSFQEIFSTLCTGGTLVLVDERTKRDPDALLMLMDRERVERIFLPYIALQQIAGAAVAFPRLATTLREIITAGEQLRITPVIRTWMQRLPGCTMSNHYGPTESHVVTALTLADGPADWPELPSIGRPIANTSIYLLDRNGQPVPIGVPGDLFIGGVALARGYLDAPERTAERFVDDPFHRETGGRMYRTGDLARFRRDGLIEYLGRGDGQVKLRGFRVELGEVEAVIARSPLVSECAATVREDNPGDRRLVAYVVLESSVPDAAAALRALCKAELPEFMVPSSFVILPALPLTPSGKIDRRALPAPEAGPAEESGAQYQAPRTTLEHEVVQIWERLFPGRRIGIHDDFFESGGHSLLAVQMLAELERVRGRRVPLAWLFESSTVEALAARLGAEILAAKEPPVVVLQPGSPGTPLAFVQGDVRGGGWYCRRFAPLVAPESPFFVLPTIGVDGDFLPWTIEAMAAIHVAALRKVQPSGPYYVAGFCIGGLIAFEIAQQLRAAGETVEKLIIIDSAASNARVRQLRPLLALVPGVDANTRLTRQAVLMRKLRWYELRMRTIRRQPIRAQWAWVRTNLERRWRRLLGTGKNKGATPSPARNHDQQTQEFASAMRTRIATGPGAGVLLMQERAASVYFPRHYHGCIDLIWADAVPVQRIDPTHAWGLVADRVNVHPLSATHLGLITNDLPLLAEEVRKVLDRGEG